jgi:hypothetical protein
MVARAEESRLEPLCVRAGLSKVLLVFSFEEEAEMFVHLGGYESSGWRAREGRKKAVHPMPFAVQCNKRVSTE